MGTWGAGNFDDDTAADYLSIVTSKLISDTETAMSGDPSQLTPDEWDGVVVPCNIELLTLIAKQRWVGTMLPQPSVVAMWRTKYLGIWDAEVEALSWDTRHVRARRAVLVKAFGSLERLCDAHHAALSSKATSKQKSATPRKKSAAGKSRQTRRKARR